MIMSAPIPFRRPPPTASLCDSSERTNEREEQSLFLIKGERSPTCRAGRTRPSGYNVHSSDASMRHSRQREGEQKRKRDGENSVRVGCALIANGVNGSRCGRLSMRRSRCDRPSRREFVERATMTISRVSFRPRSRLARRIAGKKRFRESRRGQVCFRERVFWTVTAHLKRMKDREREKEGGEEKQKDAEVSSLLYSRAILAASRNSESRTPSCVAAGAPLRLGDVSRGLSESRTIGRFTGSPCA